MPRFSPYLTLAGLMLGSVLGQPAAHAAPSAVPVASQRTLTGPIANSTTLFRSIGILGANGTVSRTRSIPPGAAPTGVATTSTNPTASRTAADTTLKFSFDSGFTRTQIDNIYTKRSALLIPIFGQPAPEQLGKTITVRSDGPAAAYQPLLKTSSTSGGTIFFKYSTTDSIQFNAYNFTRLVLLAFQGPNTFSYDYANGNYIEPWQNGFSDAAALLISYSADGSQSNFDPTQISTYTLPVYDFFNHPELGNAYIYSRKGTDLVISDFRASMAQAAWLKVAIEDPQFFVKFNKAYYAQVAPRTAVSVNTLRSIAAGVVPKVEGLSFNDWIRRQYALDTNVTTGQKLFAAALPLPIDDSSDLRTAFTGVAEAFVTDSDGDEVPSTGYGSVNAFDEKGQNINSLSSELRASTLLDFNVDKVKFPGQAKFNAGFDTLGNPNSARVTIKLRFLNAESSAVFPGVSGGSLTKLTYFGVTSNGDSGTLTVTPSNSSAETATVVRGAWTGTKTYVSGPAVKTSIKLGDRTFIRNTAWLAAGKAARGIGFVLDGAATSDSFILKPAAGASTLRMISLPFFPLESDEAAILNEPVAQLTGHLAHYRPNLAPGTLSNGVITFGVDGDHYELYPNITSPMAPGRGYWLTVDAAAQRVIKGTAPATTTPYEVPVLGGWNQIGVPINRAFDVTAIKVRYGGFTAVSLNTAITNGWVRPGIWEWQPAGGYARVDGVAGAKLQPFVGYYLYAVPERGVSLVFDSAASSDPTPVTQGWTVPLSAKTATTTDAGNRFGVSTLVAAAKPPAAAPVVTLQFLTSGSDDSDRSGAGAASGWADSFVPDFALTGSWKFVVDGTNKDEKVNLSWGDLKGVPEDIKLTLTDTKTAISQQLKSNKDFSWTSEGKQRAFTLQAARIAIAALRADAGVSGSWDIGVALNIPASGHLEIQDSDGNMVKILKSSGIFTVKRQTFNWNLRDSQGKLVPAGRYVAVWIPDGADNRTSSHSFVTE